MALRAGIDLGGTKIQAVVLDDSGDVQGEARLPTPTTGGPEAVADAVGDAIHEATEAAGVHKHDIESIGIGSPGVIDVDANTVTSARNLPDWEGNFPLGKVV